MKRRDFFKAVTGFLAGINAAFVPKAKSEGLTLEKLYHCKDELEKAEKSHKYPTLDEICKNPNPKFQTGDRVHISATMPEYMSHYEKGKDATVICSNITQDGHGIEGGKEVIYILEIDGVGRCAWYPEYLLTKIGTLVECFDSRQRYDIGTRLVTSRGLCFRYIRNPIGTDLLGRKTTKPFWCWIPESEFEANPPEEYLTMLKIET